MENLIFLATPEKRCLSRDEVMGRIAGELAAFGFSPVRVLAGKAVYPKAKEGGEDGEVVSLPPRTGWNTLPALKPRLRLGTYGPVVGAENFMDFTFRAMVDYNPDNTLEQVVRIWQNNAKDLYEREKVWVSALFFQQDTNIYIAGNTHPELTPDISVWKQSVRKLVQKINTSGEIFITRPFFYDLEKVFNS